MRQKVLAAIKDAFGVDVCEVYQGFVYGVSSVQGMKYPCVWLNPIELTDKPPRKEEATYKATLYYFDRCEKYTEELKEEIWSRQEQSAIKAYLSLQDSQDIDYADSLQCEPDEFALTPSREISMKVTFLIHVPYCNE